MKTSVLLFLLALATFLRGQATFELDKPTYVVGESITATWTGGPGNSRDWIGIYPWPHPGGGQPDGTPGSTLWYYVNGSQTAGEGLDEGSVTFTMPPNLAAGNWAAYFLADDGYDLIAPLVRFTVEENDTLITSFSANRWLVDGQTPVTLTWNIVENGPPLTSLTLDDGSGPVDVMGRDSIEITPTGPDTYTLYLNEGYGQESVTFAVDQGNTEYFSIDQSDYFPGEPLEVSWSGAAGGPTDWLGIYRIDHTPGPQPSLIWDYSSVTEGTHTFRTENLAPGEYFVVRLLNDRYDVEYGPIRFSVVPFQITGMQMTDDDITLTWTSRSSDFAYDIEESTNLEDWDYFLDDYILPAEGEARETSFTFPRPADSEPARFYRVLRLD